MDTAFADDKDRHHHTFVSTTKSAHNVGVRSSQPHIQSNVKSLIILLTGAPVDI
jgi:hypothetical protein